MEKKPEKPRFNISLTSLVWIALLGFMAYRFIASSNPTVPEIAYSDFKTALADGRISSVTISDINISGKMTDSTDFTTVRVDDPDLTKTLEAHQVEILGQAPDNGGILGFLLTYILPFVLIFAFWFFLFGRKSGGGGSMGNIFSFGKSKARVITGEQTGVTFKDVGGAGEAITELKEVTEFLKNPNSFSTPGRENAQRRAAGWPTRHRKNTAGQGHSR